MKINIISLGKFKKNPPFNEIFEYYKKRISLDIQLVELKTYDIEKRKKLQFEKNEIQKYLQPTDCVVVLDNNGKMTTSEGFASFFKKKMLKANRRICFLIGSELGLDDSLKGSNLSMSFGKQTWPHLLVRIMLIEQIYRSLEIIKGSPYHK